MQSGRRRLITGLAIAGLTAPIRGFGQPAARRHLIGFLGSGSAAVYRRRIDALRAGLEELGYAEGTRIRIEYRWAEGRYDRLPQLAGDLLKAGVEVLVTHATPGVRAARQATSTVPIVVTDIAANPVVAGYAHTLARPGGNITGSAFFGTEFTAKRLELLKQAVPSMQRVGWLVNPDNAGVAALTEAVVPTAKQLKIELRQFGTRREEEFAPAFASMKDARVEGLVIQEDPLFTTHVGVLAQMASAHRLVSAGYGEFAEAGGTLGYGVNFPALYRRAAYFVDRILKGAKPGDLPFEQAEKYELVINAKSAKALGITLPDAMLIRADTVIR